jgi:hypothetical protein
MKLILIAEPAAAMPQHRGIHLIWLGGANWRLHDGVKFRLMRSRRVWATLSVTWAVIEQKSREDEWISQEVAERFYDLLAVGEGGRCLKSLTSR